MADPVQNTENFVVKFAKDVWAKVEDVDSKLNAWVAKVTNGHSSIAIIIATSVYWLVKPVLGLIVSLPALLTKVILDTLAVAVPALISAVPAIVGITLGLLALVEVKNFLKSVFK